MFLVERNTALFRAGDEELPVTAWNCVVIPAHTPHRYVGASDVAVRVVRARANLRSRMGGPPAPALPCSELKLQGRHWKYETLAVAGVVPPTSKWARGVVQAASVWWPPLSHNRAAPER